MGEPENTISFQSLMVVGWGRTYTEADKVSRSCLVSLIFVIYKEIKTVSTADQQKLSLPLVSIDDCKEKYLELGAELDIK